MLDWEEKLSPLMKEKLAKIGELTAEEKESPLRVKSFVSGLDFYFPQQIKGFRDAEKDIEMS